MAKPFDIVVVPDFSGKKKDTFEARTLFFLASWLENAGSARNFPLHVASIGVPPPSVCWLAEQCRASITIHDPYVIAGVHGFPNKQRGLRLTGKTDKVYLLDTDVLVLSDPSPLNGLVERDSVNASPNNLPRVPERYWPRIYASLGIEMPRERITSMEYETGIHRFGPPEKSKMSNMPPFYNGGILFVPWAAGLADVWEEHMRHITAIFEDANDEEWKYLKLTDEASLATAMQYLTKQGFPVVHLPNAFHGGWRHIYGRTMALSEIVILHMTGSFTDVDNAPASYMKAIGTYQRFLIQRFTKVWVGGTNQSSKIADVYRRMLPALVDVYQLGRLLRNLYSRYVYKALQHNNPCLKGVV
jgi:hypothetical protein